MSEFMFTFYKNAILNKYPNATNLRQPNITGSQQNVILADVDGQTYVFKFAKSDITKKNEHVSKIYNQNNIPCPVISAHKYKDIYFEEYKILPGKTLFEHVGNGIEAEKIKQIYREILVCFAKMGQIKPYKLTGFSHKYMHAVAEQHISNTNNYLLGKLFMGFVYLMNQGNPQDKAVFHTDITPKNVVVSEDGHLVGFLDIDTAAVSDVNFAFGAMAAKYAQLGFDIKELFDYYEQISGKKLNRNKISAFANLNNFAKKMLWQHSQRKK